MKDLYEKATETRHLGRGTYRKKEPLSALSLPTT